MNTQLWGPPTWRILHGATNVLPHHADLVKAFVTSLGKVLPCKYCRESCCKFISEMPDVCHAVADAEYGLWLYELHNKVNNKLLRQQYVKAGVPEPLHTALVESAKVPYAVIQKRALVQPVPFTRYDVVFVLGVMALNADESDKRLAVCSFIAQLAALLVQTDKHATLAYQLLLYTDEFERAPNAEALVFELSGLLPKEDGGRFRESLEVVRAHACNNGVCH